MCYQMIITRRINRGEVLSDYTVGLKCSVNKALGFDIKSTLSLWFEVGN